MKNDKTVTDLVVRREVEVRFSEVDSMGIVWHGSYVKYFEDAREEFGKKYSLGYLRIFGEGYYAPIVKLEINYKKPLTYGDKCIVEIRYINTEAAKICFEYRILAVTDGSEMASGKSVQVFLDKNYKMLWNMPGFYFEWKKSLNLE